ncbi:GNAT family N-acetyltransferase [Hoeflea sp. WL0058]|uniref:GNAT family N-acetyltransferase n=1 Tax=Flavimaribacter sediminis TaxID=2865987 RepID=A0AAE3D183_9HYPH|nr:GNAT family N-acetyltransferase [Flavimaribacter sediminis]MBW8637641.1 GNAT family N-acetyltransferase [Flavimaribacter sediminis]
MFDRSRPGLQTHPLSHGYSAAEHFLAGGAVNLRPMTAFDAEKLRTFLNELTDKSRRERFLRPVSEMPDYLLRSLTRLNGRRHVAFMAEATEEGSKRMVGEARYAVDPEHPGEAEFAIAVDDRWQGRGIAVRLLDALENRARTGGLRRLFADTLDDNHAMLSLARRCGYTVAANRREVGVKRLVKDLAASSALH